MTEETKLVKRPRKPRKAELIPAGKSATPEQRQAVLADAKVQILAGLTLAQIAQKHGISKATLENWLHALGDEYTDLRKAWIDNMLIEAGNLLKGEPASELTAQDIEQLEGKTPQEISSERALGLARARELWKRATWYAERRDRQRYGDRVQVDNTYTLQVDSDTLGAAGDLLKLVRRKRERVIEHQAEEDGKE